MQQALGDLKPRRGPSLKHASIRKAISKNGPIDGQSHLKQGAHICANALHSGTHRSYGAEIASLMRISEFIEWSNRLREPAEIFDLYKGAVADHGYSRIALVATASSPLKAVVPVPPQTSPVIVLEYPEDYVKHYFEKRRYEIDPVIQTTSKRHKPFFWRDLVQCEPLTPQQRLMFEECRHAGLHEGVTIPLRAPWGQHYAICLAKDHPHGDDESQLDMLCLLGTQFFLAYAHATQCQPAASVPSVVLSERERECLLWTARGKSSWEISVIVGLSENTVSSYLKNAMKKLGTTNRVLAVVQAIKDGLIHP